MTESFPRLSARTQRFTLGEPRNVVVSADGERIVFLRSPSGTDASTALWVLDVGSGEERLVAEPADLLGGHGDASALPAAEQARRERMREGASGITDFATDADTLVAAFALSGRLFVAGLLSGTARELDVAGPVLDPRPDPLAQRVAYVSGRMLCIGELDGQWRVVAGGEPDDPDTVSWGSAEFVAAEEMGRTRGYWWSPDGTQLAVTRVDTRPVNRWFIADPADPAAAPKEVAYPKAGSPNAEVSLHVIDLAGSVVDVEWDRAVLEYLTEVNWSTSGLIVAVQSRDQRRVEVRRVDTATGATELIWSDSDAHWVDLVRGTPCMSPDGELVTVADRNGARRLLVDDQPASPDDLQVRAVESVDDEGVLFLANPLADATVLHVWRRRPNGELEALTDEPGIHAAATGGRTVVIRTSTLDEPGATWVTLDGVEIASHAERPPITAKAELRWLGDRRLATALLLPTDHDGRSTLPVLLDPYAGPHASRVVRSQNAHLTSQWFADQGFAVLVIDGRGTPGRGPAWEREISGDLATGVLHDQIEGLHAMAADHPELDLDRVAIRGWSFGGYLAALAVMRRPDVFHAAIAGAPVTEWRLYDTHYTERYLGDPAVLGADYDGSSLLASAAELERPLLLIHGLADDNVVAAHTLQLSSALLAAGKPHEVLPLCGVSHMTPQEQVAENLLLHQLAFLRRSLAMGHSEYGAP